MSEIIMPREAGRIIAKASKDVKCNEAGVKKIAQIMAECIKSGQYSIKSWKEHDLFPKSMDTAALEWIFVSDTLNFSFWSEDETNKYVVKYKGQEHTGFWSLSAAMNRALDEGIPFTDPNYYADISREELKHIFRSDSDNPIPLFEERLNVLHEAGQILKKKYDGRFENVVKQCNKSGQNLLKLIVSDFPSYRDVADFGGQNVAFYKRAQILIGDIWSCFEGQGYGEFHDIDSITLFADYRLPQVLVYFQALEYSKDLLTYLRTNHMLTSGERYEVEIRGCSIYVTDLITEETKKLLKNDADGKDCLVNAIIIDNYLWDYRREHNDDMKDIPFHRIRCIYY